MGASGAACASRALLPSFLLLAASPGSPARARIQKKKCDSLYYQRQQGCVKHFMTAAGFETARPGNREAAL
jgi:hypothetical protein